MGAELRVGRRSGEAPCRVHQRVELDVAPAAHGRERLLGMAASGMAGKGPVPAIEGVRREAVIRPNSRRDLPRRRRYRPKGGILSGYWFLVIGSSLRRFRVGGCVAWRVASASPVLIFVVVTNGYLRRFVRREYYYECVASASVGKAPEKPPDARLRPPPARRHEPQRVDELAAPDLHERPADPHRAWAPRRLGDHPDPRLALGECLRREDGMVEDPPVDGDVAPVAHAVAPRSTRPQQPYSSLAGAHRSQPRPAQAEAFQ
jgi:hypothetical protein